MRLSGSRSSKFASLVAALGMAILSCCSVVDAKTPMAEFGTNKVKLEVARTSAQIQRGLMFRQSMPEDAGMVFIFHPPRAVRFWMFHCFMSLDMIFIRDGKVAKIAENVPPCRSPKPEGCPLYPEDGEIAVSEVVEVNAGYCKRHGIKEGDTVKFTLDGKAAVPATGSAEENAADTTGGEGAGAAPSTENEAKK